MVGWLNPHIIVYRKDVSSFSASLMSIRHVEPPLAKGLALGDVQVRYLFEVNPVNPHLKMVIIISTLS